MFKSIRARLVVGFSAIALVTAIALGVVLLAILQSYYANLELDYLRRNAQTTSSMVSEMISSEWATDEVQARIENLAFLVQTRIEVYTLDNNLLYDSGPPQNLEVDFEGMTRAFRLTDGDDPNLGLRIVSVNPRSEDVREHGSLLSDTPITITAPPNARVMLFQADETDRIPFGFGLSADTPSGDVRSDMSVTEPVLDPIDGGELGAVRLSQAPALGAAVLRSVAQGWTLAAAFAVLLAALLGGYISRRMSAPVLALTDVTTRMAHGDLSSRANVMSRDELGQLARAFNEMAEQVETTVTTLHRFVSDAAHELHTPLTALRGDLDLAVQEASHGNDAATQQAFIARAQAAAFRLEALTNNLLDLSRLEAQTERDAAATLDLTELLQQSVEAYASQAEQAGLTFTVVLPDEPLLIRGDAKQVQRALNNLFDNACKFTSPGGSVTLQLVRAGNHVQLSVADTGIGIPPDDLPRLFSRFHRGRNASEYPGSGLGLAIVKAIMDQQEGEVLVENGTSGPRFTLQWAPLV